MMRDNIAMDLGLTFKYEKFLSNIDLTECEGKMRICVRDKEAKSIKDMFLDRARLHRLDGFDIISILPIFHYFYPRDGYQHRTILTIDRMILDLLLAADEHLLIETKNSGSFKLSEACDNLEAFSKLTDEPLLWTIQNSSDASLQTSRDIYERIVRRQLYKHVW